MAHQLLFGGLPATGAIHHDRRQFLAEFGMRETDRCGFHHVGVAQQCGLDMRAGDVLTTADHHVLAAAVDKEVTVIVEMPQIAGVQPTVGVDGAASDSEVAVHHGGGANQHLTHIAIIGFGDGDFDGRQRPADGVGVPGKVGAAGHREEATALGHAPHVGQSPVGQLRHAAGQLLQ